MPEVGRWQKAFLVVLFSSILLLKGKTNFSSLARHSELNEKTFRRGFRRSFDFERFNLHCIEQRPVKGSLVAALDASHLPKSGKKTYGLGKFYSGCLGRAVRGLELSEIALIDRDSHQAKHLLSQHGRPWTKWTKHALSCTPSKLKTVL